MNSKNTAVDLSIDKWQRMATLVGVPPLSNPLQSSFQRLVLRRWLAQNVSVFFLQYAGLLLTTLHSSFSTLWFASGTATAFLFLRGKAVLPGLSLGTFMAYCSAGLDEKRAAACALVLVMQSFFLMKLSYRYGLLSLVFYQRSLLLNFLVFCGLSTLAGSALLTLLCLPFLPQPASFSQVFAVWWLANFNGSVLLACALFGWDAAVPDFSQWRKLRKSTLGLFAGAWLFLSWGLLGSTTPRELLFFGLLLCPLLLLLAYVYRWYGTLTALFALAAVVSFAAYFNSPLFSLRQPELIFLLDGSLSLLIILGMVAAV